MVMAFPDSQDSTTDVIARDVFLDALEDAELVIQIQAQRPRDLVSALQTAQHMESVMKAAAIKNGRPIRVVVQTADPVAVAPESRGTLENELRDLRAGQWVLLDAVRQLERSHETRFDPPPGVGTAAPPRREVLGKGRVTYDRGTRQVNRMALALNAGEKDTSLGAAILGPEDGKG